MAALRHGLIVTEGITDQAAIAKVLRVGRNFGEIEKRGSARNLDPFWRPLFPQAYPVNDDYYERPALPRILALGDLSVAVHSCGGNDRLFTEFPVFLDKTTGLLDGLDFLGIVVDADGKDSAVRMTRAAGAFRQLFAFPPDVSRAQACSASRPGFRTGVFVVPDAARKGVLETLLIEAGGREYAAELQAAGELQARFPNAAWRRKWGAANFEREKSLVGIVTALLKPGKTAAVTIEANDWITPSTVAPSAPFGPLNEFLGKLTGLPDASSSD